MTLVTVKGTKVSPWGLRVSKEELQFLKPPFNGEILPINDQIWPENKEMYWQVECMGTYWKIHWALD